MFCQLPEWKELKRLSPIKVVVAIAPQPGSWDQAAKGDVSALESHSPGLAFPVGNLKLGLRELNSS